MLLNHGSSHVFDALAIDVTGPGVEALLNEAGGHRIQRIPPNERRGRIHTSTVTVAAFRNEANGDFVSKKNDFRVEWFSGTGSGGQHRNRKKCCCRVIHIESGMVETRQSRSRESNLREAKEALIKRINEGFRCSSKATQDDLRRSQVGGGTRGEKIRTYRAQDNSVFDHQSGKRSTYKKVMKGGFPKLWS